MGRDVQHVVIPIGKRRSLPFVVILANDQMRSSLWYDLQTLPCEYTSLGSTSVPLNLGKHLPQNLVFPLDVAYSSQPSPSAW